jgi:hypothetical protein
MSFFTFLFNAAATDLQDGTIVWGSSTIKARLVDASVVPAINDTAMTGYTAVGTDQTLGSKTQTNDTANDRTVYDAADAVYASPGTGSEFATVVIYKFITDDAHSLPIFSLAVTPTITAGTSLTVVFDSTGVGFTQQ